MIKHFVLLILGSLQEEGNFNYQQKGRDWPSLFPTCGGQYQSPINLVREVAVPANCEGRGITVEIYNDKKQTQELGVSNNFLTAGDFARINITYGPNRTARYEMAQFHMHSSSEHQIDGRHLGAEVHFVFKVIDQDADKVKFTENINGNEVSRNFSVAVIGILFDAINNIENDFLRDWNPERSPTETFDFELSYLKSHM